MIRRIKRSLTWLPPPVRKLVILVVGGTVLDQAYPAISKSQTSGR